MIITLQVEGIKTVFLITFCYLTSYWVEAQTEPAEFGNVSMEELTMSKYPQDTSAAAIILFDRGETTILAKWVIW